MKRIKRLALTILVLSVLSVLLGCKSETHEEQTIQPIEVKVSAVREVKTSFPINSSGALNSKTEAKLSFKTGGIIQAVYAGEGETVNKGKLLAKLDLSEIEAQFRQAELAYEKAKRDLKRVENLFVDSVATLENYQDATTAMEVAELNLKIAKFNLQYSKIVAPADGKILRKLASTNELVSSGMPVFLFAPLREEMVVRVNLTDKEVIKVELSDTAHIFFDAYPDTFFKARITEIANAADPMTGTYEVELQLDPAEEKLISGFIARVRIFPKKTTGLLEIPIEAMVDARGRTAYVYRVLEDKPLRQKISIDRIENGRLIIGEGLKKGDLVITEGANYIDKNSQIKITSISR